MADRQRVDVEIVEEGGGEALRFHLLARGLEGCAILLRGAPADAVNCPFVEIHVEGIASAGEVVQSVWRRRLGQVVLELPDRDPYLIGFGDDGRMLSDPRALARDERLLRVTRAWFGIAEGLGVGGRPSEREKWIPLIEKEVDRRIRRGLPTPLEIVAQLVGCSANAAREYVGGDWVAYVERRRRLVRIN